VTAAFFAWLLNTKLGRTIGAAALIAITAFAVWHYVDSRAFQRGQDDVQAKWDASVASARQRAAQHTAAQTDEGAKVAATATQAASEAHASVVKTDTETKEVIRYVYRDRPTTAPVQPGSLVHPLDPRVQDRIELGVDQARAATR
jgi:predicted lipid-binding transport protein (Tim44 family)